MTGYHCNTFSVRASCKAVLTELLYGAGGVEYSPEGAKEGSALEVAADLIKAETILYLNFR